MDKLKGLKAQGMSLNVIIVAVIVLIVLVVLVLIFTGKIGMFRSQTTETSGAFTGNKCVVPGTGNECVYSSDDCQGGSYDGREFEDCNTGYGCCLK